MDDAEKTLLIDELAKILESELLGKHGPVIYGEELRRALGYQTPAALRQAVVRNTVAVPLFNMEHRRGKFALVKDIARYLAQQRFNAKFGVKPEAGHDSPAQA